MLIHGGWSIKYIFIFSSIRLLPFSITSASSRCNTSLRYWCVCTLHWCTKHWAATIGAICSAPRLAVRQNARPLSSHRSMLARSRTTISMKWKRTFSHRPENCIHRSKAWKRYSPKKSIEDYSDSPHGGVVSFGSLRHRWAWPINHISRKRNFASSSTTTNSAIRFDMASLINFDRTQFCRTKLFGMHSTHDTYTILYIGKQSKWDETGLDFVVPWIKY